MKYHLDSKEEVKDFIKSEVLVTSEAMEILDVSRSRMSVLIKTGKLEPVKSLEMLVCFKSRY